MTPDSQALIDYALIGVFIALLSILGRRLSLVHYERNRQHTAHARELLERSFPDLMISRSQERQAGQGVRRRRRRRRKSLEGWADIYWFVTAPCTVTPLAMAVAANAAVRGSPPI
jgi:hypothetical protein